MTRQQVNKSSSEQKGKVTGRLVSRCAIELEKRVKIAAVEHGLTMQDVVNAAVEAYLPKLERGKVA